MSQPMKPRDSATTLGDNQRLKAFLRRRGTTSDDNLRQPGPDSNPLVLGSSPRRPTTNALLKGIILMS
jgi:hypothetical protein